MHGATKFVNEQGEGGQREVQQGDDLLLLIAHLLVDLADRGGSDGEAASPSAAAAAGEKRALSERRRAILLEAAALLEHGKRLSPFNFQFTLELMELYSRLGGFTRLCELYNDLKVKHVTLDSLSYLVLGDAVRCGFWNEARSACNDICRLRRTAKSDMYESTKQALSNRN